VTAIRVLVVDDERPARERLRHLVERDPRVELVATLGRASEAISLIREHVAAGRPIQMVFLDVQMPEIDGFGVVTGLANIEPEALPAIIFVTAFDQYAIRAFDAHAIDYLLKPYTDERFAAAVDRAIGLIAAGRAHVLMSEMQALMTLGCGGAEARPASPAPSPPTTTLDRLVLKSAGRVRLLSVDQITWIEAAEMYVKLHTRDGATHLQRGTLGGLERALDPQRFVRIHRSAIVNIALVTELRPDAHGDYVAVLRDTTEVRVGRAFRSRLEDRLGRF
jgi:two-component system LytT family response regulator